MTHLATILAFATLIPLAVIMVIGIADTFRSIWRGLRK